ncbi:MAG: type II toxin-antitoxin system HicB family antitoxin [Clostridia bacterium]|nr:type II toxin-antitoxin system HicB family antitoxin [Clostridia bacterium]
MESGAGRAYTIVLEPVHQDDGRVTWSARVPDLPGCGTSGETLEQVASRIQEAMDLWIEDAEECGEPIPAPRTYSGRFSIRVTPRLHRQLDRLANAAGVSLNHYVTEVLAEHVVRQAGAQPTRAVITDIPPFISGGSSWMNVFPRGSKPLEVVGV